MDLRVLVLVAEPAFGEMIRAQVDNLGCTVSLARTYDEGSTALGWVEAAVIDLAGDGLEDLNRLRVEAPTVRILAIAQDESSAQEARAAGAHQVLIEPFPIPEIGEAVRGLAFHAPSPVIDLRDAREEAEQPVDSPWWATK